jgi:antitoxin (DNA-binding transcriptional repressor) of toxin-antitoxin stability system
LDQATVSITDLRVRAGELVMLAALGTTVRILISGIPAAVLGPLPRDQASVPAPTRSRNAARG